MVDPEEEALAAVQAAQNLVEKAMEGMLASTESLAASVLKAEREGGQMLSRQRSREVEEERHRVTREENSTLHALVNKLTGGHMSEIQGVKGREEAERKLEEVQATLSSAYGDHRGPQGRRGCCQPPRQRRRRRRGHPQGCSVQIDA